MKESLILLTYRMLLPVLFAAAFPGWVLKMIRRGGLKSALHERVGLYSFAPDFEPCGAVHFHAISVGESILALKLLQEWSNKAPETRFVLAVGTATAHALVTSKNIPGLRVTYIPLDFPWMIRSYLSRFSPSRVILLEGDIWPNFLKIAEKRNIPVQLANARVSPRSARRFLKFSSLIRPFFSKISTVCIQEKEHASLWQRLGVDCANIHHTGSIKFDTESTISMPERSDFREILEQFGENRPIVLAASTFPGEETLMARAIFSASPDALPVIVPRHSERRNEVKTALTEANFHVILRSEISPTPSINRKHVLVIDTTGELAAWTSHADVVIIGKSFLSSGGQNPAEAILARKPLITGPHMENFQPLVRNLIDANAILTAQTEEQISTAIQTALEPNKSKQLTDSAFSVLTEHHGATKRHFKFLHQTPEHA